MTVLFPPDSRKTNKEQFRLLIDAVHDYGIYMVDPRGLIVSWNTGAERIKGYRADEVVGKSFEMFFRKEDVEAGRPGELLRRALEEGKAVSEEWRLRKGGLPFLAEVVVSPIWNEDGTHQGFAKVTRDITQRKSLEEMKARQDRLLETERQFRAVSDSSPMLIWLADTAGLCTWFNKTWSDYTGRALAEEAGEGWTEGIHPEERPRVLEAYHACVQAGRPFRMDYRLRRRDGVYRWMLSTGSPRLDADGALLGFTGNCVDIQERKELEDALDRSRNQLDAILRGVDHAILAQDASGRLVFANEAAAAHLGAASAADLLSGTLASLLSRFHILDETGNPFPPERLPGALALKGRSGNGAILRFRPVVGGEERWTLVKATPLRAEDGSVSMAISFFQDITAIKAREMQERKDKEQLRIILEGISDAILVTSTDGRMVYANQAAVRFLGRDGAEALYREWDGSPGRDFEMEDEAGRSLPPEETPAGLAARGLRGSPAVLRVRYGRDAAPKWVVAQASPILDEDGSVQLVVQILRDITEAREGEERLRQSQKMEAVGRLAGGIAHDFNNLLTAINGYSEIGLSRTREEEDSDLHGSLVEIREAGRRAAALTHQLLAFSRKQILAPRILDLNEVVGRMDSMLRRLIGEDIHLSARPAAGLPPIRADISQVEQVILNLAVNARDAMPQGGTLTMETALARLSDPEGGEGEDHVMLVVADTGVGMEESVKARIFEPFFTTKEAGKGTGMGLSTVYGIVKQSGGSLEVESEPGRGATFKVYFPAAAVPSVAPAPEPSAPCAPAGRGVGDTVLLVEDEEAVRNLVCRILGDNGYVCLAAENGEQALALGEAHGGSIRLLLTDVVLKGMSGPLLADRMRVASPGMRVLYMSGYTDNAIHHHGVLGPGVELINKPFSIQSLLHRVNSILNP